MPAKTATCAFLAILVSAQPLRAARKWRVYHECSLIDNPFNDGDSFHVKCRNRHYIFRLCYVDAPEMDDAIPKRVGEQAEYWGISDRTALAVGKDAAGFTREFLSGGFTVYTQFEDAKGRSDRKRYFAMVRVADRYLSEALVENGLARIYGYRPDLPDGTGWKKYLAGLESIEKTARREGRGAWGREKNARRIRVPEVEEQDVTLVRSVAVYSLDDPPKLLAILPKGAPVRVLGAESVFNLRIRYSNNGQPREGKCRRTELGI